MDLFNLNYEDFERFLSVFFRVGGLVMFAPILGSGNVPGKLKIGFILIVSVLLAPLAPPFRLQEGQGYLGLVVYMLSEVTAGIIISFAARLIFMAVQMAGTIIDFQMGFGVVNVIDPQTNSQVSLTSQFLNILAILMFLIMDGHHFFIQAISESFRLINPHQFNFSNLTMGILLQLFTAAFVVAIKMSAPVMAVLIFISAALGLVARTVPQMNVFILGFPLQIGVGMLMLGFSMSLFGIMLKHETLRLPDTIAGLLQSF